MEDSSNAIIENNDVSTEQSESLDAEKKSENEKGCGQEVDLELEELLDSSLADFGKHIPKPHPQESTDTEGASAVKKEGAELGSLFDGLKGLDDGLGDDELMKEMEQVFGEEFARQAEAQLTEAMDMLKFDNPELLNQFDELAKKVGLEDDEEDHTPLESNKKESKKPSQSGSGPPPPPESDHTLQSAIDDTLRRIQESSKPASATPPSAHPTDTNGMEEFSRLTDMMSNFSLGENGEGEEQVMKMMEGMMNTLLSKEVLYPSLVDFCKQYPEWLDRHSNSLSPEDRTRYVRQLEIMKEICSEFEREKSTTDKERQEKILQLMQELQKYGQPPEELGGMPLPHTPSFLSGQSTDSQCGLM